MATRVPIQSIVLNAATSSVTFTGIDQSYTDLEIVLNVTGDQAVNTTDMTVQFNGDTSTIYSRTRFSGNGSAASSGQTNGSNNQLYLTFYAAPSSGNPCTWTIAVPNYSNSTTYKSVLARGANAASGGDLVTGTWRSSVAVTSVKINTTVGNFAAGSTFDLYGISTRNAKNASASGGTAIYYDSTYAYHVFTGTGTFTPNRNLTCDYLVIGGGGGAGSYSAGGGGGAGGLRSTVGATGGGGTLESAASLTANTVYTVLVGAGGAGAFNTNIGTSGGSSSISGSGLTTITSAGGGYGGGYSGSHYAAASGGSGGGANYATYTTGGTGTANQGYGGGNGVGGAKSSGGGGGGAGGVGAAGTTSSGGNGGTGVQITAFANATSTGASGYYAGGGGGTSYDAGQSGTGGAGGGGNAKYAYGGGGPLNGSSGLTNTGGGGGAAYTTTAPPSDAYGGHGGSGIVIVRYVR